MATLTVTIECARGLKDGDMFGKMDPYCTVKIGGQKWKTSTKKKGGTSPVWNETHTFQLQPSDDVMIIEIYDEDMMSDDHIGTARIDLTTVRKMGRDIVQAPVQIPKSNANKGALSVTLNCTNPMGPGGAPAAHAQAYGAPAPYGAASAHSYPGPGAPAYGAPPAPSYPSYPPPGQPAAAYGAPAAYAGYSAPPAAGYPPPGPQGYPGPAQGYPPQAPPAQGYPPQAHGYPPQAHGYPPQGHSAPPAGYPQQHGAPGAIPGYNAPLPLAQVHQEHPQKYGHGQKPHGHKPHGKPGAGAGLAVAGGVLGGLLLGGLMLD